MKMKNIHAMRPCLFIVLLAASLGWGQIGLERPEIQQLISNMQPTDMWVPGSIQEPNQPPRLLLTPDGYLRHLAASPETYFPPTSIVLGQPEETARNFIIENAELFGIKSTQVDFNTLKTFTEPNHDIVHFRQTYVDIPVFGAEVIMQLDPLGGVEYVLSDITYDTNSLDDGSLSTVPTLSPTEATAEVHEMIGEENPDLTLETTEPVLEIFDPAVLGSAGAICLVWDMEVYGAERTQVNEQVLLDAHTGKIVRRYSLNKYIEWRQIYDAAWTTTNPGTLQRSEGGQPSGIVDVDNAYDLLGDTYNFYWTHHQRDGIVNGLFPLSWEEATVRYCFLNPDFTCRGNAMWAGGENRMYFAQGYVVDDVVGHEYTHGVTMYSSGLRPENQSGAIDESFSDIWGEFIDLTHNPGADLPADRWLLGEDIPGIPGGAIRNMADPPAFPVNPTPNNPPHPDRLNHPSFGQGDVHSDGGVGNKLCYLITDGDTFNGFTVTGMQGNIDRVADLYYEVNVHLLNESADYRDLGHALERAAANLGWSIAERNDLHRACRAVEIAASGNVYINKSFPISWLEDGTMWFPFNTVREGVNAAFPGDILHIKGGTYSETLSLDKTMEVRSWGGTVTIGR